MLRSMAHGRRKSVRNVIRNSISLVIIGKMLIKPGFWMIFMLVRFSFVLISIIDHPRGFELQIYRLVF